LKFGNLMTVFNETEHAQVQCLPPFSAEEVFLKRFDEIT